MDLLERFSKREDIHQSVGYARLMDSIGWFTLPLGESQLFVFQLGPASIAKLQRPRVIDIKQLLKIKKKLNIFRLVVEPFVEVVLILPDGEKYRFSMMKAEEIKECYRHLSQFGFHVSDSMYAHTKTFLIDIASPFPELIAHFPVEPRYNIRKALKQDISYSVVPFADLKAKDKHDFGVLHDKWTKEKGIVGYSSSFLLKVMDAFESTGFLVQAMRGDMLVGSIVGLTHSRIGYYFYGFSDPAMKPLRISSGMIAKTIEYAQILGCDLFDLYSAYDERYPKRNQSWSGFSEFKSRFGSIPLYYPPLVVRGVW